MKKMVIAIVVSTIITSNSSFCMDHTKILALSEANILLDNKGKILKGYLDIEATGKFTPELFKAEVALQVLFDSFSKFDNDSTKIVNGLDRETLALATLMSKRIANRASSIVAIAHDDAVDLEKIITADPYMLRSYCPIGESLLHKAIILEKKECVKKLLKLKANPNYVCGECERSALHYAVDEYRSPDIVTYLLAAGADPEYMDSKGKTPFDIVCAENNPSAQAFEEYGYLFFSSRWPYKNPFMLLKDNAKYLKELEKEPIGSYELESASNSLNRLFKYIDRTILPLRSTKSGVFVKENNFILKHASKERCQNFFGKKMLSYAQKTLEKKEEQDVLLRSGMSWNGNNILLQSFLNDYSFSSAMQYDMLNTFIRGGDDMSRLQLCLDKGFNPNGYRKQKSLLHYAIESNKPDAIKILAKYNPDLVICYNPTNEPGEGYTPLAYAYYLQRGTCANELVDVIKKRRDALESGKGTCGLTKHILNKVSKGELVKCQKCLDDYNNQLHGL